MIGFLFARQRSGTGALGSILDQHPELKYAGEVLHPDDRSNGLNFFSYVEADADRMRHFFNPDRRPDIVDKYFTWLSERVHPKFPIIDIKYSSVHHWNTSWQGIVDAPWILRCIREKNFPVLHLKRKNYLETYVSGRLAEENKVWHAKSAEELRVHEIVVDIGQMSKTLVRTTEEVAAMDVWLHGVKRQLTLEYADLFDAGGIADSALIHRVQELFGLKEDFSKLTPNVIKQAPPLVGDAIVNVSLVRRALRGTEYAWMLKASKP